MKKTLLIAVAAFALIFTACNKADVQDVVKGMTLSASVDATKATIAPSGSKRAFSWETGDQVNVTAPAPSGGPFIFTKPATGDFYSADAVSASGTWTAYYPTTYDGGKLTASFFVKQDGTLESAMEKYCMTGSCVSDGSPKLSIKMNPQFAILEFTNQYPYVSSNIWFSLGDEDTKYILTEGLRGSYSGVIYHFVVPAGDYITIYFSETNNCIVDHRLVSAGTVITLTGVEPSPW